MLWLLALVLVLVLVLVGLWSCHWQQVLQLAPRQSRRSGQLQRRWVVVRLLRLLWVRAVQLLH